MYVDTETILTLAKLITALGTIAGICVAVYNFV